MFGNKYLLQDIARVPQFAYLPLNRKIPPLEGEVCSSLHLIPRTLSLIHIYFAGTARPGAEAGPADAGDV